MSNNVHDATIRVPFLSELRASRPRWFVVQEWAAWNCIVDVGAIGADSIDAFEIKSAADSVTRLRRQEVSYSRIFSRCTLITAPNHLRTASKRLPEWWGITVYDNGAFLPMRDSKPNPAPDLALLLWSSEATQLVRHHRLQTAAMEFQREQDALSGFPRQRPSKHAMLAALRLLPNWNEIVCETIKKRKDWRTEDGRSALGRRLREAAAARKETADRKWTIADRVLAERK